jgi:HAMP domain-containing protein
MKLLLKFNIILILVFGAGIGIAAYISRNFLERSAREQVLQQARLMIGAASGMRTYTSVQVGPMLEAHQKSVKTFLPQTIPSFAATETFNYLRSSYPDYTYKEATLNPTNLRDRAVDWEADIIERFRNNPKLPENTGERVVPGGRSLFVARPIRVEPPCLQCHSTPAAAPAAMVKAYGMNNGFGWKLGDTVGAQIVSVPMSVPLAIAEQAFRNLVVYLGGVALVTLLLLDLALIVVVIRPVSRLAATADQISNGNFNLPEIPVHGSDEISNLARSFNRMYFSVVKAIRMLEP